ncbi:hypothetical protein GCM10023100_40030 [Actinocorallia cavernae]|uniref:Uncharacterized protein n=2 Tax=Actinomycetes TaxID=1760 RepID=A0ABP8SU09_9ACTN
MSPNSEAARARRTPTSPAGRAAERPDNAGTPTLAEPTLGETPGEANPHFDGTAPHFPAPGSEAIARLKERNIRSDGSPAPSISSPPGYGRPATAARLRPPGYGRPPSPHRRTAGGDEAPHDRPRMLIKRGAADGRGREWDAGGRAAVSGVHMLPSTASRHERTRSREAKSRLRALARRVPSPPPPGTVRPTPYPHK